MRAGPWIGVQMKSPDKVSWFRKTLRLCLVITWKLSAKGGVASVLGSDPLAGSGFRACLSDVDSVGPSGGRSEATAER